MQATLITLVLLWVSVALQGAWPVWLRPGGQAPDLVVAVIVCIALRRGAVFGCLAGLLGAVFVAAWGHIPIGGLLTAYMLTGVVVGFFQGTLFAERITVAVLVTAVAVLFSDLVRLVFVPPPDFFIWLRATSWTALFTAFLSPLVMWAAGLTHPREPSI